jgi:hypothetical protein
LSPTTTGRGVELLRAATPVYPAGGHLVLRRLGFIRRVDLTLGKSPVRGLGAWLKSTAFGQVVRRYRNARVTPRFIAPTFVLCESLDHQFGIRCHG